MENKRTAREPLQRPRANRVATRSPEEIIADYDKGTWWAGILIGFFFGMCCIIAGVFM